jgi:hypothetical protein
MLCICTNDNMEEEIVSGFVFADENGNTLCNNPSSEMN